MTSGWAELEILGIVLDIRTLILILAPLLVIDLVLIITAILSLARKALPWGQKWVWLLLVLFVNIIGPIVYFAVGSNILEEKAAQYQDLQERYQ